MTEAHAGPMRGDRRFALLDAAMPQDFVADALAYLDRRQADFTAASVYRRSRGMEVDATSRDCLRLGDLGTLRSRFVSAVETLLPGAVAQLGITAPLTLGECEICAYGAGGAFERHQDAVHMPGRLRAMTCVYYLAFPGAAFTGGALRIHGWPKPLPGWNMPPQDIAPVSNRIVFLPSILPHEVLEIQSESTRWRDRRFNITCWFWQSL